MWIRQVQSRMQKKRLNSVLKRLKNHKSKMELTWEESKGEHRFIDIVLNVGSTDSMKGRYKRKVYI